AHHGIATQKPLRDLERALDVFDGDCWREASAIASALDSVDSFAAGLRLVPAGAALAERLELPEQASPSVTLAARSAPAGAVVLERVSEREGVRAKAGLLLRVAVPPRDWIRTSYPETPLAGGYARYFVGLPRKVGPAVRSWRSARIVAR